MPKLSIGIKLASLGQPFRRALETAGRLGADGVEIDGRGDLTPEQLSQTGLRQLRKLFTDLGLEVCAVEFATRHGYQVVENIERRVEATKQAMRFARSLGASIVVNHVGAIPAEPKGGEWELLVETLSDIGRFGHHVGATLAAKTGGEAPADLKRLIEALPTGSLMADFSPGALAANAYSAVEGLDTLFPYIGHVHATDGVRDLVRRRGMQVPLGEGAADIATLVAMLETRGYRGYYTLECHGSTDPVAELGQGVEFLRSI